MSQQRWLEQVGRHELFRRHSCRVQKLLKGGVGRGNDDLLLSVDFGDRNVRSRSEKRLKRAEIRRGEGSSGFRAGRGDAGRGM